jgi:hypothetical protein
MPAGFFSFLKALRWTLPLSSQLLMSNNILWFMFPFSTVKPAIVHLCLSQSYFLLSPSASVFHFQRCTTRQSRIISLSWGQLTSISKLIPLCHVKYITAYKDYDLYLLGCSLLCFTPFPDRIKYKLPILLSKTLLELAFSCI